MLLPYSGRSAGRGKELLLGRGLGVLPGMGAGASGAAGALAGAGWWGRELGGAGGDCNLSTPQKVVSVM